MLNDVKDALRISHNLLDADIQRNIDACFLDLGRVGIITSEENADALTKKAVEIYCKAQYDYLGKGEQFQKNYEALRDALSLAGDEDEE